MLGLVRCRCTPRTYGDSDAVDMLATLASRGRGTITLVRAIFFDEDDAQAVVARLRADGFEAHLERERLSGEDDDEDHPWAVLSDAPAFMLEVLVDTHDGWLDEEPEDAGGHGGGLGGGLGGELGGEHRDPPPPLHLPTAPKRIKRPDLG